MKMMEEMAATAETETTAQPTAEDLSVLTVAQLRARARALGLPGCSKMAKAALIEAIEAAQPTTEPEPTTEAATAPETTATEAATTALGRRLWRFGAWAHQRGLVSEGQAKIMETSIKEVFMTTTALTPREMAALRIVYILLGVIKRLL